MSKGNDNADIPPPPLAVLAVQEQYEAASASIVPPVATPGGGEPPSPPKALPTLQGIAAPPAPGEGPGPKMVSLPTAVGLPPPPGVLALAAARAAAAPAAGAASPPTAPVAHAPKASMPDLELPARRSPIDLIVADVKALRERRPPKNVPLLAATGALALSLVVLLVAGVASIARSPSPKTAESAAPSASAPVEKAAASAVAANASAPAASPPAPPPKSEPAPCALAGEARTIAARAVIASGVEAEASGGALAFGFAASGRDAVAVAVDPTTLAPTATAHAKPLGGDARHVTPLTIGSKVTALPVADRKGDKLSVRRVTVATGSPVDVGVADGAIVWAPHGKDAATKLFTLEGEGNVEALRATSLGDGKGLALAFRRGNAIYVGFAKGEPLEPAGGLARIGGLGQVGSPAIAASGEEALVAWADRAGTDDEWRVRLTKVRVGDVSADGATFTPPAGGPGGAAMSPSLAALGEGRALLAWTEGPVSSHQVRAITLDADGRPIGGALAISAAGLNAGQPAAAALADGRGAVAYLAAKGRGALVQAAPVRCAAQ
jgi:hypothetical protein